MLLARSINYPKVNWRFKVAEWQYLIEHIALKPATDSDAQLEKILQEHGEQGWELVQVLKETPDNPECRLIFKTEKVVAMD
jgi:hypothetical protein